MKERKTPQSPARGDAKDGPPPDFFDFKDFFRQMDEEALARIEASIQEAGRHVESIGALEDINQLREALKVLSSILSLIGQTLSDYATIKRLTPEQRRSNATFHEFDSIEKQLRGLSEQSGRMHAGVLLEGVSNLKTALEKYRRHKAGPPQIQEDLNKLFEAAFCVIEKLLAYDAHKGRSSTV